MDLLTVDWNVMLCFFFFKLWTSEFFLSCFVQILVVSLRSLMFSPLGFLVSSFLIHMDSLSNLKLTVSGITFSMTCMVKWCFAWPFELKCSPMASCCYLCWMLNNFNLCFTGMCSKRRYNWQSGPLSFVIDTC